MKKVETLDDYKDLLRQNKEERNRVDTNCLLLPGAMNAFITSGTLFVEQYSDGLVFFVDEGNFFNLYYFWESGVPLPNLQQDKPVLIEELNNNGSRDVYISQLEPVLKQAGFSLFKHNLQVAAAMKERQQELRERYAQKKSSLEAQGYRFAFCTDGAGMKQVVSLWESALNPTDIPQSHKTVDPDNQVLCIFDNENTLCAAKWWHHSGKTSEGRHVVTHKDFERRGLASTLQLAWLVDGLDHGVERYMTWIADTNAPSLAMHQKIGFLCNGRTSKQYILK